MLPLSVSMAACLPPELFAPAGTSRPPDEELQPPRQTAVKMTSARFSTAFISAFFQTALPEKSHCHPSRIACEANRRDDRRQVDILDRTAQHPSISQVWPRTQP